MSDPRDALKQAQAKRGIRPGYLEKADRLLSEPDRAAPRGHVRLDVYEGDELAESPIPPAEYAAAMAGLTVRRAIEAYVPETPGDVQGIRISIHLPARPELPDLGSTASEAKTKR